MSVSLVQLLCRTAKLGWFDADTHRQIVEDAKRFLERGAKEPSPQHYLVGLRILHTIVQVGTRRRGVTDLCGCAVSQAPLQVGAAGFLRVQRVSCLGCTTAAGRLSEGTSDGDSRPRFAHSDPELGPPSSRVARVPGCAGDEPGHARAHADAAPQGGGQLP